MTRTIFLGERPSEARVYEIVEGGPICVSRAAKPGPDSVCDAAARDYITSKLAYFTHRTGRTIGLDCHEAGDVSGPTRNVESRACAFSVEPGIIAARFGVRIEDLVLITEDGCEVLNHLVKARI